MQKEYKQSTRLGQTLIKHVCAFDPPNYAKSKAAVILEHISVRRMLVLTLDFVVAHKNSVSTNRTLLDALWFRFSIDAMQVCCAARV